MSSASAPTASVLPSVWRQYNALTKPRVIQLIVFCALIGMVLAVPGLPSWAQVQTALLACLGIWLVAGAAAAFNCVVEQQIDAKMRRTAWRPTARGQLSNVQTLTFSAVLCAAGSRFRIRLAFAAVVVLILVAQLAGLAWFSVWLPLYPALVATLTGYLAAWPLKAVSFASNPLMNEPATPTSPPEAPADVMEAPADVVEALPEPPVKVVKKAARKTVKKASSADAGAEPVQPAIKVAKKAAPAKKAAKKSATIAKTSARKGAKKAPRKSSKPPEPG